MLNDSGARVLARAEEIVALYAKLGEEGAYDEAESLLRIGAIASVQSTVLPSALAALRESCPSLLSEPFKLLVSTEVKGENWHLILVSHPFLRYERTSYGGRLVTKFLRDNRIIVTDAIELDEISGLMHLVAKGLGVALVPLSNAYLPLPAGVRAISLGDCGGLGLSTRRFSEVAI